ncbi:DUF4256 domain-containing protein [Hydrogenophaga laconesensis]|uniref:DUF4256 domain-containing protein n=1 Tax=Hydrogenophaga laconesensis TaxID=1805971 RepID=A0ABU1VB37_9BURK|nr:DUF4256 domain-containing protein [Hydrogenophaga laconesensis]MDR7094679.1 hypothetical protein [Hydrogenophaga laconesensis]
MQAEQRDTLLRTLKQRFDKHTQRHTGVRWAEVEARLQANPDKLKALLAMEETGGEPDVIGPVDASGACLFCDCAPESPSGRRSLCYDAEALASRKENKPADNAMDMAKAMGISLLTEAQYRQLQAYGEFDLKTSSWVATPPGIRKLGGALFCDRRYGQVFTYHNGAQSYYAARGFRGWVSV